MNQVKNNKRRKKWPWITGFSIVAVIAVFALMMLPASTSALFNTRSATVQSGSISVTVVGTGNLEYDDALDIEVPAGITIDDALVESGDSVSAGETLAKINPVSIKTKIASVRDEISTLDRQINYIKEDTEPDAVKTNVSGRIKKIYAQKNESVLNTISKNDALILLSIDEKMAMDFESSADLSVGDKVDVVLENGSVKKGTIEKADNGKYTVTLTDNGPKYGEAVTVKKSGDSIGTGTLYIHQPVKITATSGTVKTIHVAENQKVSGGKKLITLKDLPVSADCEELLADRNEKFGILNTLLSLSKTNTIISEVDGVIIDVNVEDGKDTISDTDESNVIAFTVAPNDNLVLAVEVDELDILSIEKGMDAEITFDAISDMTFSGRIIKIADCATANSGVAKYTVKVLIPKDDAMKAGMNATATIMVDQKENILTIPITALQEISGRIYVYTQEDPKTGALSGEIEVITGVANGENVEILSGLTEGDTVYYMITASENQVSGYGFGGAAMQRSEAKPQDKPLDQ